MDEATRVLIADDEASIRYFLRETLEESGHVVDEVETGDAALEALAARSYQIAFLDIRMPGLSGLDLLERVRAMGNDVSIVIITAENTFENAVEAMKRGALDYLVKPFAMDAVLALVEKARRTRLLEQEVRTLRREVASTPATERLVGRSSSLLDVFKTIGRVAGSDIAVLITGESGTGKELVARALHGASPRVERPFVTVNAAAIPRDLLESELFGHERGAFTGAVDARPGRFRDAHGGTLFLDEIGDMPLELQAKLLRVLQSGEVTSVGGRRPEQVDVRILAATHRDLDQAVRDGGFREDLLYRLRVVPIHMPALRDRPEDIGVLAQHFVGRYADELGSGARALSEATLERLAAYPWPGNVRELENAIKRALVLAPGDALGPDDFGFLTADVRGPETTEGLEELVVAETEVALREPEPSELYRTLLARVERPLLETVLARTSGNQIRAAAILGINRNTLRKKLVELEIKLPGRP